ncbi:MAG: hypothetical protein K2J73_00125 [Oscillospiraceae bacterium]|nr:hypothetical protein [Oscillospiraceae bacterium]
MKKILSVLTAIIMTAVCFTSCSKDEAAAPENTYAGILTKVKLGMPMTKIVSLQPDNVTLNFETDTRLWSVNTDTEIMELREVVPADNPVYYVEDSIITYDFKTVKGDENIYLCGYMSEAYCCLERQTARDFFDKKTAELAVKHGVEAAGSQTGTKDIDMELVYTQKYDCPSYTVIFTMKEKYDTVEGVDGYYGSYFSIEVKEKEVKAETPITTESGDKKETEAKEEE